MTISSRLVFQLRDGRYWLYGKARVIWWTDLERMGLIALAPGQGDSWSTEVRR